MKKLILLIAALVLSVSVAHATVYPRFDAAYKASASGQVLVSSRATVWVYSAGTTSLPTLYLDSSGTTTIANPVAADASGNYQYYVAAGFYDEVVIGPAGTTPVYRYYIPVGNSVSIGNPWVDTRSYTSFAEVDAAAIASESSVLLASNMEISTVITTTAPFIRVAGGSITCSGIGSITFSGPTSLGESDQVFYGCAPGAVTFAPGSVSEVTPDLWDTSGTTADVAIQAAIDSIKSQTSSTWGSPSRIGGGGRVRLLPGDYYTSGTVTVYNGIELYGSGKATSRIIYTGTSGTVITLSQTSTAAYLPRMNINLHDFAISGGGKTNVGIYASDGEATIVGTQSTIIERLAIDNTQVGMLFEGGWINRIADSDITDCIVGIAGKTLNPAVAFNDVIIEGNRIQNWTRHAIFSNGRGIKIRDNTIQVDAWTGLDSSPVSIPTHTFPVGIELHGKNVALGLLHASPQDNEIISNWFEVIKNDDAMAAAIYLDGVDTIGGTYGPIHTYIRENTVSSSVNRHLVINAGSRTVVMPNSFSGTPNITLGSLSAGTHIYGTYVNAANLIDNSGGSYTFWYPSGGQINIVGKLAFAPTAANAADTNIYRENASVLKTDDTLATGTRVESPSAHFTFTSGMGNVHSYTNMNATTDLNTNPTGTFPAGFFMLVSEVGNTHGLNFDSTGINKKINAGRTGLFAYDGVQWTGGQILDDFQQGARIASLSGGSVFTPTQGTVHSINNTGSNDINYNPSGTFLAGHCIDLTETGGAYGLIFDSTGLNTKLPAGKNRRFCYDGTAWKGETFEPFSVVSGCTVTLASSITGTTDKTALLTCDIPAYAMGTLGALYTEVTWSYTNNANNKTTSVEFGGDTLFSVARTTTHTAWTLNCLQNTSATEQKSCHASTLGLHTTATADLVSMTKDTRAAVPLTVSCTLANASDTCSIERVMVWIIRGD